MGPKSIAVALAPSEVCEWSVPVPSAQPSFLQVIIKSLVERFTSVTPGEVKLQIPRAFVRTQLAPEIGVVVTPIFCVVPSTIVAQPDNTNAAATAIRTFMFPPVRTNGIRVATMFAKFTTSDPLFTAQSLSCDNFGEY